MIAIQVIPLLIILFSCGIGFGWMAREEWENVQRKSSKDQPKVGRSPYPVYEKPIK